MAVPEPFPLLSTSAEPSDSDRNDAKPTRRRQHSAGLGTEICAGDTGAPGLAASFAHQNGKDVHLAINGSKRFSKRRKARSLLRRAKHFTIRHPWTLPLAILAVFLSLYALNPTESNTVHHFIFLSYRLPASATPDATTTQYGKGKWDIAFVAFYTVVLSFTREFVMQEILRPLARRAGLKSRNKQARFMEQMYTALYFGTLGPAGMYVMSRTPVWYFNTAGMYADYPHKTHEAVVKFYYLFQAAYWAQQAIVLLLGMEKPRKDFKELVGHHIVSLSLIALSYRFHFTYIGLAVYVTHDISDFFLATSKTLNYIDHFLTGPYFFIFMCVWIYLRHYLNLRIIYSLLTEFRTIGPYEIDWATEQYKGPLSNYITLGLLSSLQALNLFWLFFIIRIAYRFVVHRSATDDRSDEESDGEIEDEKPVNGEAAKPLLNGATNGFATGSTNGHANGHANGSATKRGAK